MEDFIEEGIIKGAKDMEEIKGTWLEQKGNCICKINGIKIGTGFFCKIPFKENIISVLITNYHIIDDDFFENNNKLKLYIDDKRKILNMDKNSKLYSSPNNKYDIMIIKMKEEYDINNYLEIDQNIFNNNSELSYKDVIMI